MSAARPSPCWLCELTPFAPRRMRWRRRPAAVAARLDDVHLLAPSLARSFSSSAQGRSGAALPTPPGTAPRRSRRPRGAAREGEPVAGEVVGNVTHGLPPGAGRPRGRARVPRPLMEGNGRSAVRADGWRSGWEGAWRRSWCRSSPRWLAAYCAGGLGGRRRVVGGALGGARAGCSAAAVSAAVSRGGVWGRGGGLPGRGRAVSCRRRGWAGCSGAGCRPTSIGVVFSLGCAVGVSRARRVGVEPQVMPEP